MKILQCHNHYQQAGGEDRVFDDEHRLLTKRGHEVLRYTRHNDDIAEMGRLTLARKTLWNSQTYDEMRSLLRREQPDVLHCTNIFPIISPSVYYAARDESVPVVQSLHNYRLLCPNALFLRDGAPCESCLGKLVALPAIRHNCYRDNKSATAMVAAMQTYHRLKGTWHHMVDAYVALSEFSRQKFIEGGLPAQRIHVKPNCVDPDPGFQKSAGEYAIFVGRLSQEKGLDTLLTAWSENPIDLPLKIVGDGPLCDLVQSAAEQSSRIEWLSNRPHAEVIELISNAACLVLPSICYENCPKTLLEAYACGTPVVASRIGALEEMVEGGATGASFTPGDAFDLFSQVVRLTASPLGLQNARHAARELFERQYSSERNYELLMSIYEAATKSRQNELASEMTRNLHTQSTN